MNQNFYSEYSNKKTSVISDNLKAITYEINSSKNVGELARLENLYLSNTKANTKIKQIKSLIDSKEANLLATERRNEMLRQKDKRRIIEEKLDGFKVNGLKFSQMFTDIYLGDFNDIPFSAEDKEVSALLYQYMLAYGTICKSNLPDDQVEIEELNCKHKQLITDANGYTTTNCLEYGWDGIGIYAKPDLYKAYRVIVATRSANDFYDFFDVFSNPNSYRQNLYDEASKIISIKSDIYELIRINKCSKKLLDKFEANLIAFIKDDASFLFDKDKVFEPGPNQEVDYTKQHNMEKFIDHLLAIEKKKWLIGYYPGSVKDVKVLTRDSKNRPNKIIAKYGYDMIIGKADYKVTLLLEDGIPTCLKFPTLTGSSCKTPYHKVVENFVNGMYVYEPSN